MSQGRRKKEVSIAEDKPRLNRRAHRRVAVEIEVDCRCEDNFLFAYITDLSAMGIFVRTEKPHPPGAILSLTFTPQGVPALSVSGQVMWINPHRPGDPDNLDPGMGIQFIDLDDATKKKLTKIVKTFAYLDDDETTLGNS
jgi:type IV pilus assembly protein PilZ